MPRLFAIGDIHGCRGLLDALLGQLRLTPGDRMVFLGDYVDRGPDSRGVIERLLQLRQAYPETVFLRGNHEQMLLDTLAEWGRLPDWEPLRRHSAAFRAAAPASDAQLWLANGGHQALVSYDIPFETWEASPDLTPLPASHLEFLQQTVLWHVEDGWLFVHADADPAHPPAGQDPYRLLWARNPAPAAGPWPRLVVGHTPTRDNRPADEPGRLNLDTGAVYGRALSCCDLRSGILWQAH